ncbi:MAG: hypothetical protein IJC49_03670 [Clostridia bacterium]|nr:hypothetical protein [Clostridia bacterium]
MSSQINEKTMTDELLAFIAPYRKESKRIFMGKEYGDPKELGEAIYTALTENGREAAEATAALLENDGTLPGHPYLEKKAEDEREREVKAYLLSHLLTGKPRFTADGKNFNEPTELTAYMKTLLDRSYESLRDFCHGLIDYEDNLAPAVEGWLLALGKDVELSLWRAGLAD